MDSPPREYKKRPASMVKNEEVETPTATSACPATSSAENHSSVRRVPKRSTSTPPKNGSTMLGNEYTEYSSAKFVW